jgi:predicted lysophospholipase L1 biosynthesis ABC-type transport system permease subunit
LINRELARRTGGEEGALGRTIRVETGGGQREVQVVGVIEDVMYDAIRSEPTPMLLRPVAQVWSSQIGFLLRGTGSPESLMPSVRDVVRSVDPDLPVLDLVPSEVQYDNAIHRNRSLALLFTAVAVGGLLLAACGVFGVVSYVVRRRHRELAVRRVLGADTLRVVALVLRGTMTAVVVGLVVGLGAGLLLARVLSRFLFGIPPGDPLTFAAVSAFLLLVSSLAALLPTRQAVRLDPAASLRQD